MSRAARAWTGGIIAALLLAAAGVLLAVALGRSLASAAPFEPSPDDYQGRTQALVLDVNPAESYDGRGVDVEFTAGVQIKVADIEIDHGVLPHRGDQIAIAYDTDDPDDAVLVSHLSTGVSGATHDGGNAALALSGLGCGVAAIVAGIVTIVWARRAPSGKVPPAPAYGYGPQGYGPPGYGAPGYGPPGYGGGPVPPYGWMPPPARGPDAMGQQPRGPSAPDSPPPQPPDPGPDGPASPWGGPG